MTVGTGEEEAVLTDPSTWSMGWMAVFVPNAVMLINHARGGSAVIIRTVLRSPLGFHGLLLLPPLGVLMEKSVYDTSMALRGIDPNANPEGRHGGGFPSGGHALPSLSLVPLRERALKPRDLVPSALLELFATTTPDDDPGGR